MAVDTRAGQAPILDFVFCWYIAGRLWKNSSRFLFPEFPYSFTETVCFTSVYLQVNALGEWIIGIYLHEFTNNEREISIPNEAAECGIEKFRVHC